MLFSPGNSPRHISSPSPSLSSSIAPNSSDQILKPSSSKSKTVVLDEDTYVSQIERIIERDYFPDIPKLRDRLDWLEAVRSQDPVLIRDAQLKIMERRRRGSSVVNPGGTTGRQTSATPGSTFVRNFTPLYNNDSNDAAGGTPNVNVNSDSGVDDNLEDGAGVDKELGLDDFFRWYTSEDNDSFNKILEKVNKKRKERYDFLLLNKDKEELKAIEDNKKRDRITDGYGTSDQPVSTLDGWKYTAKNLLMYHPADNGEVALTEEERAVRIKGLTKEISKPNTRFHGKMTEESRKDDEVTPVLYTQVAGGTPVPMSDREMDKLRKYDLEDLRKTPVSRYYEESGKKAENGYGFVKTPSPAPGVDGSPFITWGEIEGTPLRLEPEETPIGIGGSGDGPHFRIPSAPTRDVMAHTLSREAARKIRERSKIFQKPPLPSPSRGGSASPYVRTLSPAAQKFMRNAISKSSSSVDKSLRASYRGASPVAGTPKSVRSISRLGRDVNTGTPSVRDTSNQPW